ncbi:MAG: TM0106 family RecB-like putative nuclease, partial [Candidatus Baltobacteraceae bacterium]
TEGFGQLPAPAPGDVFFDMEGDPLFEVGTGLEYLFGSYCPDDASPFYAFWGVDREAERRAFEACVDFFIERRRQYPTMHIYHYASYEKTALRKLSQRHPTREAEVDQLLKGAVLVDLYAVVRQSLMISQPSYSIKKLEPFYGLKRSAGVAKGDESIVQFEKWLQNPDDDAILNDIERYNEEDCRSTWMLREWLLGRRDEAAAQFGAVAFRAVRDPEKPCHAEVTDGCKECAQRESDRREEAKISGLQRTLLADASTPGAALLGHLLAYHRREEKPVWWRYFDRTENVDQLQEFDAEAIGGLVLQRDVEPFKRSSADRSLVYTYAYPDQPHRFKTGDRPHDPRTEKAAGEIVGVDEEVNRIEIKRSGALADAVAVTELIPPGPINSNAQKAALVRVAESFVGGELGARHSAALDLLRGAFPRLTDRAAGARIQPKVAPPKVISPDDVYRIVRALDDSYLFVQGPPGTGKTYSGARVLVDLLRDGKRVGVMAQAHKAIHNLLHEIEVVACERNVTVRGMHKHSGQNADSPYVSRLNEPLIRSLDSNSEAEGGDYNLISGNGWLFARLEMVGRLDYLVIDEAGQTSLADSIAVAPSARNVILLGDPMQLAQVSQGMHACGAERSVLQHLLGDAATVAENRGVLLDTSYRMQPEICEFISQTVYDGRLHAERLTANNRVDSPGLTGSGLRYLPVEHSGNGGESREEAARIVAEIGALLQGTFVRKDESEAKLTERDILVVTPYNAQRILLTRLLREAEHPEVRVGTVDKFQGQEAPVVFYSMATSSGEDVPRNIEFLFEKNRFNVAVSRAQCLSVLVCSPRLLDVRCHSVEQMALANLLCRYAEAAPKTLALVTA